MRSAVQSGCFVLPCTAVPCVSDSLVASGKVLSPPTIQLFADQNVSWKANVNYLKIHSTLWYFSAV